MRRHLEFPEMPKTDTAHFTLSRRSTTNPPEGGAPEQKDMEQLLEASRILAGSANIRGSLPGLMEVLGRHLRAVRSIVALLEEDSKTLYIEAGEGLTSEGMRARYHLGEGVIGKVVQSGRPIVIPQISREPIFLNRAGGRKDEDRQQLTFFSAPIFLENRVVGALGIDVILEIDRDYEATSIFVETLAQMMAPVIQMDRQQRSSSGGKGAPGIRVTRALDFSQIVGNSSAIRQVYDKVGKVSRTTTTVLLRGESGTGKELIARAIHDNSLRADKPFVKVSCAALPDTLFESELFGYRRGAFTGADRNKSGRFELAEGGTLFLDEIGEIGLGTQVKLLRILQEKEFEPLGATKTIRADVRFIAATNKDLEAAIVDGTFRADLYYRLNVFNIYLPPLSDRKSDILLLADHFLQTCASQHGLTIKRISTPAIDMLSSYHWPGNIRELENAIQRAVIECDGEVIHSYHLPATLQTAEESGTLMSLSLREATENYEQALIQDALKTTRGNRAQAARLLRTSERIIGYKVKQLGIDCQRFR